MRLNATNLHARSLLSAGLITGSLIFNQTAPAQLPQPQATQSAAAKPLVFDVASVRASSPKELYGGVRFNSDGVTTTGTPLKYILLDAYNQSNDLYWSGIPSWLESTKFNISAKFDPAAFKDLTDEQRHTMFQALLADRFKLAIHTETRDMPEYALVVTKGGPKLRDANPGTLMRDDNNKLYCRAGLTNFRQCTMAEFARDARIVGIDRIVIDKTGLAGRYDFELNYAPPGVTTPPGAEPIPDIYEAIQDKLGLKLQPIRGSVSIFVIDHIERPTEN